MNILYIDHYAGSPEMGMEFRPYYLSREWEKMGHKVSVIGGNYSHLRKKNPAVYKDMQKETIDGIDYYWLKTGSYQRNGAKRAFTMLCFCFKLNKWKKWINTNLNPDVVISSSTYPIDSIPSHLIAKSGIKSSMHIHEVHDMWPSTLVEVGGMSRLNPFVVLMQLGENYAYKHADAVVSLLKYSKDYMVEHGLSQNKFHCVSNGIVKEEWDFPEPLPEEHQRVLGELRKEKEFIVGYFGGHAISNHLMFFLRSVKEVQDDQRTHFVLVGDGVEKKSLIKFVEDNHMTNVSFLPPVSKRAVPSLTGYFDIFYIGAMKSPLYRFGVCFNKAFDCMMAGKPILFAVEAPITSVEECGCGLVIKPDDTQAIIDGIKKLRDMSPDEREQMGLRGRKEVLSKYTYEVLAEQFAKLFEGIDG